MGIIKEPFIEGLIDFVEQTLQKARIMVAGESIDYPIFKKTRTSNKIWIYVLLETEIGHVEEVELLNSVGDVMANKPVSIVTQEDGHMVAFEFTVSVREGV